MKQPRLRIAFAGDKHISFKVLKFILSQGIKPLALLVSDKEKDSTTQQLIKLCPHLHQRLIFKNDRFKVKKAIDQLKILNLDYIISIHFPFVFPEKILSVPTHGILNLHPAYLPYNRGWHTATWAILNHNPFGATLHFMDKAIDTGDIVLQKKISIRPEDTANSLYKRALSLEFKIFKEAWPSLINFRYQKHPQKGKGSTHLKKDLLKIQKIGNHPLLDQLRSLSTSKAQDYGYFVVKNKKYRVKITIIPEK